ncbi:AI-2E family transporter [Caldalkalibacillus mannanilyticus]|uniref:AI-2E family transporter n=1 Tax=Caldalkalibacillus mannanilyticus TaxID=1418 RepID=UPI0004698E94|nr:AI-2E family transporter [Caldalkalibacillus mannanilyticus]
MEKLFSVQWLIRVGILVLGLIALYLIFLILPFFIPVWKVIRAVAIPFIISMIFAYLLHPLVDFLLKFNMKRVLAILLLYLFFFGGMGLLIWKSTPVLMEQMKDFVDRLPEIEAQVQGFVSRAESQMNRLPDGVHQGIDDSLLGIEQAIRRVMGGIVETMGGLIGNLFALIVIPFLVFYLLLDVEVIQKTLYFFVPHQYRKAFVKLWKDIDESLGEYIRGQIIVSVIVGILAFLGYYFVQLPYPFFFALFVGITNIIPYFGPYIGAAPAVLMALFTSPSLALWIILINTVIQMLEGNVLGPWILGKRLHIHPVFIIFALLVGAEVGGIVGLILAVPIFVVFKVIILNTVLHLRRYQIDRMENV